MAERFRDAVVWVTGASSGIGEALAVAWSAEGARVVLSARKAAELERVRLRCMAPERHIVRPLDLTNTADIEAAAREVLARIGHVDVLVHSGGVSQRSLIAETDLAVDRTIMEVNYFGAIALTKAVLPSMLARRSGHIVPISSVIGYVSTPLRSAYAASKHALHGWFDALRAETAKDGIRVTIVCPGYVRTKVTENALRGDGTPNAKLEETHARAMPPEQAALRIIDGVARGKDEIRVGGKETLSIALKRFFPGLVSRMVRMK